MKYTGVLSATSLVAVLAGVCFPAGEHEDAKEREELEDPIGRTRGATAENHSDIPSPAPPFSEYQGLLDSMPFGSPADSAQISEKSIPVSDSFAAGMQLLGFFEEEKGIRAAILDRKDNSYFSLYVGESEGGIKLIDIDYDKEEVVLRKGGEVVVLTMRTDGVSKVLSAAEVEERIKHAASYKKGRARE